MYNRPPSAIGDRRPPIIPSTNLSQAPGVADYQHPWSHVAAYSQYPYSYMTGVPTSSYAPSQYEYYQQPAQETYTYYDPYYAAYYTQINPQQTSYPYTYSQAPTVYPTVALPTPIVNPQTAKFEPNFPSLNKSYANIAKNHINTVPLPQSKMKHVKRHMRGNNLYMFQRASLHSSCNPFKG